MADYGFCRRCNNMVPLSFMGNCKRCGAEVDAMTKMNDALWNAKTEAEKRTFINGLTGNVQQQDEREQYNKIFTRLSKYSDDQLQGFIDDTNSNTEDEKAVARDILKQRSAERSNASEYEKRVGPFKGQYLVYSIDGVRGRHIDVFEDKVVINTDVTIGSVITNNATDGEKTIFFVDCIGIQYKPSGLTIGYLQIETASSTGNNQKSNFFNENTFTFEKTVISNEKMKEVLEYIKGQVGAIKKAMGQGAVTNNTAVPLIADELMKLKQLVEMGVLTQEEFDAKKKQLLGL